jgi:MoxR-like ATPase
MPHSSAFESSSAQAAPLLGKLKTNLESVLLGKTDVIQLAMVALLAEGHILIEDVPEIGRAHV